MAETEANSGVLNCWEHKGCGLGPGGARVAELGMCPAAAEVFCDGMNRGRNGGRLCWAIPGTPCEDGGVTGDFRSKIERCKKCGFFRRVKWEEGCHFQLLKPGLGETDLGELHRLLNDVVRLMSICRDIFACLAERPLLVRITEHARTITRSDSASTYLLDEEGENLVLEVHAGEVERPERIGLKEDLAAAHAATTRVLCMSALGESRGGDSGRAVAAIPVGAETGTVGVLELVKAAEDFSASDEWFLGELGLIAGMGIENSRHVGDLKQLKRFDKAKSKFVAMLMHQISSPLATVACSVQALRQLGDKLKPEDRQALMDNSLDRINTIQALSRRLLDLAAIRGGGSLGNIREVSVWQALSSEAEAHREDAEKKGIELAIDGEEGDAKVLADADGLQVIFANLIGNAIKYSGEKGKRVEVGLSRREGFVRATVRDFGIGIPQEEQRRVFEEFHRGSNAAASKMRGSGLGLAMVKELVERYEGQIELWSEEGEGTMMTVAFPVVRGEGSEGGSADAGD